MKLTVLGNPARYLAPLSGGSSYLVEAGSARILLDAGPGARAALADLDPGAIDAVWISHMHHDHVLDLPTIGAALDDDVRMWMPLGERRRLDALAEAYAWTSPFSTPTGQGTLAEATDASEATLRGARIRFAKTQHSAPSMAIRIDADGKSLVYASDTAPCDALRRLARGADLLLMHTLLPTVEPESEHARIHSTAETAGALAREVGARTLLLSHRFHGSGDGEMREAAAASFGRVELARDEGVYEV